MNKKKAKLNYKPNSFDIIETGDFVICAVSNKEIPLKDLNYWNVELQEAYFSAKEANTRHKELTKKEIIYFHLLCVHIH